jgi:hypothetical protein
MRHIAEPDLARVEQRTIERGLATVAQPQRRRPRFRVDVDHLAGDTVSNRTEIRMLNRRTHDNIVPGTQAVGPAGQRHALIAELAVLEPDRLGASVQRVELLVRRLHDHERCAAGATISVGGVERAILEPSLISLDHDEPTVGVVGQCVVVLTRSPQRLVATIRRVPCANDP